MKKNTPVEETKSVESIISMLLGIAVIIIVGVLLFNYFRGLAKNLKTQNQSEESKTENVELDETGTIKNQPTGITEFKPPQNLPAKYVIKKGDSLWKISEKFYGTGFNFVDIAKENKIDNTNLLFADKEITIPKVNPKTVAKTEPIKVQTSVQPITGDKYTIQKGDSLWNISVRAYQDGFKWVLLAKTNNLVNPNLIHSDNVLTIPR